MKTGKINNYEFDLSIHSFEYPTAQIVPAKARDGREFIPKHPNIFTSANWVLEEKLDGERLLAHFEEEVRFTTRRESKQTNLMNEKTNNVPHLREVAQLVPQFTGSVLDGEVIKRTPVSNMEDQGTLTSTASIMNSKPDRAIEIQLKDGFIEYFVFDCLFYKGEDIRNKPTSLRRIFAEKICNSINEAVGFELYHLVPQFKGTSDEKKKYHEDIVSAGGEGTICKQLNCSYGETNGWVKNKKAQQYDVFITGYENGKVGGKYEHLIGAFLCSVYNEEGDQVEVCKVVPGDDALRTHATNNFEEYLNKVLVIEGQETTQKNTRVRHPRIVLFDRQDKAPEDCLYEQFL